MGKMLEIDGSMGEGGGSVLRFSLALTALKRNPIKIYNIRANRSNPGLGNQHLSAVRALEKLTNTKVEDAEKGSREITFRPKKIEGRKITVNIGTAGSTTLILQALMIPASFADESVKFEIKGGTDNPFAPPVDYLKNVTLPILNKLGYKGEIELIRRGHYPKGGGEIRGHIEPTEKFDPLRLIAPGKVKSISGKSHCVKLPGHIARRQAEAGRKKLENAGYDPDIEVEYYEKSEDPHEGPGTGIVLWAETEQGAILGANSLGKKGKPAEKVGREAATDLLEQLDTGCSFDRYMTDQIIPYLAISEGTSRISSSELTSHTFTNAKLVEKILDSELKIEGRKGEPGEIEIVGSDIF